MKFLKNYFEKRKEAQIRRNWRPKFKQKVRMTKGLFRGYTGTVTSHRIGDHFDVTLDTGEKYYTRTEMFHVKFFEPADGDWS